MGMINSIMNKDSRLLTAFLPLPRYGLQPRQNHHQAQHRRPFAIRVNVRSAHLTFSNLQLTERSIPLPVGGLTIHFFIHDYHIRNYAGSGHRR